MIRFFRSIRQGLVNEGKTSKYFRYAIGEIILVVAGILIALQVNNWNIERAEAKLAQEYIQRLVEDIERDIANIDDRTELAEIRVDLGQLIKDAVADDAIALARRGEFLAAVKQVARVSSVYLSKDTFEELRSTGYLRLLSSPLKSELFEYFSYYDERQINSNSNQMLAHGFLEKSYKVLNFQHLDLDIPVAVPRNMAVIQGMQVDATVVVEALNRIRNDSDILGSLEAVHDLQKREIRINGNMRRWAERVLEALKAEQEGSN